MEAIITDYEPVQKYDWWTLERTAESFEPPEVRLRRAQTRTRGRVARLLKTHGPAATRQQFLRDVQATGQAIAKLAADMQQWAQRGLLCDWRRIIERRAARNEHHMAELNAAAEALGLETLQEADSPAGAAS
jgi:hypothetical protein